MSIFQMYGLNTISPSLLLSSTSQIFSKEMYLNVDIFTHTAVLSVGCVVL